MNKIVTFIKDVLDRKRFLSQCESTSNLNGKIAVLLCTAVSFLLLSIANIFVESFAMLGATLFGFVSYIILSIIVVKTKNIKFCNYTSIIVCAIVFSIFVVVGGNDGFACLWIAMLPVLAMVIMDFTFGFIVSMVLQVFLLVVFWTPVKDMIWYKYNEQFCLRFPLYYFIAVGLGLVTTISLQKSQYNEQMNLKELQKLTDLSNKMARCDSLTGLSNRRCVYEIFEQDFKDDNTPHCIVMGDIDEFKQYNDRYDHTFGDEVIVTVANYIKNLLPESYIKSRWGGEEYLIAANETIETVYPKIEELRKKIQEHDFYYNGDHIHITITFGIAQCYKSSEITQTITAADNRMYIGKRMGRNCTIYK